MADPIYKTDRLILRPFADTDFDAVYSYASCPENLAYILWEPDTAEDTRVFLRQAADAFRQKPQFLYSFAAVRQSDRRLIGGCELHLENADTAEIGWILHLDCWRQGYGTEMGRFLLELGFRTLGLRRISAHCDIDNVGSWKIMEKIGMRREGCFVQGRRAGRFSGKKWTDELSYAILADEWRAVPDMLECGR